MFSTYINMLHDLQLAVRHQLQLDIFTIQLQLISLMVQKPTLKAALKEVATKYGLSLRDGDLVLMAETDSGGDWVNVNNY
ncbi:MAG: hypothetical protein Kow00102_20400 [Spirochaetota bacterium]